MVKKQGLRLIEGGLTEEDPIAYLPKVGEKEPEDWLSSLAQGSVFLTRRRYSGSALLEEWRLVNKNNKNFLLDVQLSFFTPAGHTWADPKIFSKTYELVEVLQEGK